MGTTPNRQQVFSGAGNYPARTLKFGWFHVPLPKGIVWKYATTKFHGSSFYTGWWCNVPILKNDGVRQWEGWHPIYEMENKNHLWNHQPVYHLHHGWTNPKIHHFMPLNALVIYCIASYPHKLVSCWSDVWCLRHQLWILGSVMLCVYIYIHIILISSYLPINMLITILLLVG